MERDISFGMNSILLKSIILIVLNGQTSFIAILSFTNTRDKLLLLGGYPC